MDVVTKLNGAFWLAARQPGDGGGVRPGNEVAYFRCAFTLPEKAELQFSVSAGSRYRLWINGVAIGSGPCKGDRWRHYYETYELGSYLREGENVIAAKVVAYAPYESQTPGAAGPYSVWTNAAGPCFIASGQCVSAAGDVLADVSTRREGSRWRVSLDEAVEWETYGQTHFMGAMERVHGERIPAGWNEAGRGGEAAVGGVWRQPAVRWPADGRAYGIIPPFPLQDRPIPLLFERERVFVRRDGRLAGAGREAEAADAVEAPEVVPPRSRRKIVWDAGEVTTGYVRLQVRGGRGSRVRLLYAESYSKKREGAGFPLKGRRDDAEHYDLIGHTDVYWPSGAQHAETYEPFWFRTFRFIEVEVETADEPLEHAPLTYRETGYPLQAASNVDSAGADWIRPLWDVSVRTLQRCMHETYEDCPYYEQLQYAMDTRLQILFTYAVSGDARLAARAIEDYHASLLPEGILQARFPCLESQVIPAFSLHWILMVEDYYEHTGDSSVAARYKATVDSVLDWYDRKLGEHGLVERLGYWEYFDWVPEWSSNKGAPTATLQGPSTIHNLLYVYALRSAARLSRLAGRRETAAEYEARAGLVAAAVNAHCWCEERGLYREGPAYEQYSQHAQVWAVLAGAVEGEAARTLMERMLRQDDLLVVSYAMSYYMFRALEQVGLYAETEALWKPWRELLQLGLTTWPEDPFMQRSDCHGWGALPLYEFTRCLLGVKAADPGWRSIRIGPQGLSLPELRGEAVTPKGLVRVEWRRDAERWTVSGETPAGTPAVLVLPDGTQQELPRGGAFRLETGGQVRL
ncbi:family 78 glycoside hydrolase catalytic domain [Paenibacillus sp. HJGM_3]|uniref:family 78 glycoside hydrolase catalytic domain n=1 Tax=Paenibacillus sp. HJGM_3 TaxID=3379816 RepID=UPI0038590F7E